MGSFFSGIDEYRSMDLFTLLHSTTPLAQRLSSTALVMPWASISFWVRSPPLSRATAASCLAVGFGFCCKLPTSL